MAWPILPWVIGAAATALGVTGVKKGFDAKEDYDRAKNIGTEAEKKYNKAVKSLENEKEKANQALEKLGRLKLDTFANQMYYLVEAIKKSKKASAQIKDYEVTFTVEELNNLDQAVIQSLELHQGLASGLITGSLVGVGAYGSIGAWGLASTGTAISGLAGVAATNATLAWLGGGSLAAGGYGMSVGAAVLGGVVVGPALAVGGFWLASKAEEAVTQALKYSSQVDVAAAEMKQAKTVLVGYQLNAKELTMAITDIAARFDQVKVEDDTDRAAFAKMLTMGKALKNLLDIPIMAEDGQPNKGLKTQVSGLMLLT